MREEKCIQNFVGIPEWESHLVDLVEDEIMIIK
jgi:hypothetical protein